MSHSYYKNPRGRTIKMVIMFGSLCFSAYMLPKTIDKLENAGFGSLIPGSGGAEVEAAKVLGQSGLDGVLSAERAATRNNGPIIITPDGVSNGAEYERLKNQVRVMAPIRVVKDKPEEPGATDPAAPADGVPSTVDAADTEAAVNQLMELLEDAKKDG